MRYSKIIGGNTIARPVIPINTSIRGIPLPYPHTTGKATKVIHMVGLGSDIIDSWQYSPPFRNTA
jgi:hypothetical protein